MRFPFSGRALEVRAHFPAPAACFDGSDAAWKATRQLRSYPRLGDKWWSEAGTYCVLCVLDENGFKRATGGNESGFVAKVEMRPRRETADGRRQGTHKDLSRRSRPTSDNYTSHRGSENEIALGPRDDAGGSPAPGPCSFRPFLAHTSEARTGHTQVRPWRQTALGLTRWTLHMGGRANPAASRPRRSVWRPVIGRSERASPDQISGAPGDRLGRNAQVAEESVCYRRANSVKIATDW